MNWQNIFLVRIMLLVFFVLILFPSIIVSVANNQGKVGTGLGVFSLIVIGVAFFGKMVLRRI